MRKYLARMCLVLFELENLPLTASSIVDLLSWYTMLLSTETVEADDVAVDDDMVKRLEALGYFVGGGVGIDDEASGEGLPDPKERILFFNLQQRAVALA